MATKQNKTPKKSPRKVIDLPGMEGPGVAPMHIDELDELAEKYVKERDKRMLMTPREVAAKDALREAMHRHAEKLRQPDGTLIYRYDEQEVIVESGKDKVRVKAVKVVEHEE